jgi:hypothetical protein
MMRTKTLGLAAVTSLSLGLVACGGGLDVEQVRHDLDSPNGSVANQQAVMAVDAKRTGSGPALDLAVGGVPGQALTAEGKSRLSRLTVRNWETWAKAAYQAVKAKDITIGRQAQGLVADTCTNGPEAQAAYEELLQDLLADAFFDSTPNGSASYTVDLAACSGGELTGSMTIELTMKLEENRFEFTVKEHFDNACDTTAAAVCVSGDLLLSAVAEDMAANESVEIIYAWELSSTWSEDGASKSASVGGGMRLAAQSSASSSLASFEVLFYVTTPDGERYAYVWTLTAESTDMGGTVTWTLRGADGQISCTATETTVSCSGDATISFTTDDVAGLDDSWLEG